MVTFHSQLHKLLFGRFVTLVLNFLLLLSAVFLFVILTPGLPGFLQLTWAGSEPTGPPSVLGALVTLGCLNPFPPQTAVNSVVAVRKHSQTPEYLGLFSSSYSAKHPGLWRRNKTLAESVILQTKILSVWSHCLPPASVGLI